MERNLISCWDWLQCVTAIGSVVLSWNSAIQDKLSPVTFWFCNLMCFSSLHLQPKCLKMDKLNWENMKYCLHLRCFKTNHKLHNTNIIVIEGALYSSVLIIYIIIINIAISIFTSFVISYFIILFSILIATMFHDCIFAIFFPLRKLFIINSKP